MKFERRSWRRRAATGSRIRRRRRSELRGRATAGLGKVIGLVQNRKRPKKRRLMMKTSVMITILMKVTCRFLRVCARPLVQGRHSIGASSGVSTLEPRVPGTSRKAIFLEKIHENGGAGPPVETSGKARADSLHLSKP
jgi:hypothetical protein